MRPWRSRRERRGPPGRRARERVTALEIRNLSKRYGDRLAVDDLSFTVDDGALACIVGPSGCGKTTVLRSVAGLLAPDSGRIAIGGRVIFSSSPRVTVKAED